MTYVSAAKAYMYHPLSSLGLVSADGVKTRLVLARADQRRCDTAGGRDDSRLMSSPT
jgi:hypothetical protein